MTMNCAPHTSASTTIGLTDRRQTTWLSSRELDNTHYD